MGSNGTCDLAHRSRRGIGRGGRATRGRRSSGTPVALPENATVVVVGGGPAGSFFATRLLRNARRAGKAVNVIILEKRREICFYSPVPFCAWEGCNYCAGGVSPRLIDGLRAENIAIPDEVIESRTTEIVIHGDWKSIQLSVPEGREMLSVFRGARPQRTGRYENFDTFLLRLAEEEGAEVITAEVNDVRYSAAGKPLVSYRTILEEGSDLPDTAIEADFAVFAGGVNRSPGMEVRDDPVFAALQRMIPRLRPPRVRKAVIAEMWDAGNHMHVIEGEMHFVQYGSKNLHIEMASVMPKRGWITTVLLGKSIDRADPATSLGLIEQFLQLPNIRRLIPYRAELKTRCYCNPNMTVGAAKNPHGDRVALTGDLAVARLYKDGLYSAFTTSTALADCVSEKGIDKTSLARHYVPVVRALHADNRFGRVVFLLSHWVLAHPALSRVLYRAVITERMTIPRERHRLAPALWQAASGDDTYRRVVTRILHPSSLWRILNGGLLLTFRDVATERLFGLDWTGVPRYMTGVPVERAEQTRNALFVAQGVQPPSRAPQMESVFTVRIRASKEAILRQLGAFGDPDRQYLWPRFVQIHRIKGAPNEIGTVIRYDIPILRLSFSVNLEKMVPDRCLLYRIVDGMGEGGILAFLLDELRPGVSLLTIYVGFDFPKGRGLGRIKWAIGHRLFPGFAHDVIWNHSLCQIRHLAEIDQT